MQNHPPVAELVAEPLHHQRGIGGHGIGGLLLIVEQPAQVLGRILVEAHCSAALVECFRCQAGQLAGERAQSGAEFGGPSDSVSAPEREPCRFTERRNHQHPVVRDLGDPPACRAQRDDVSGPGLVDHLLVEFAYPRGLFGVRPGHQVHGEQPAVRDGAAGGDRQPLRTRPRRQQAGITVVDQPRPQLCELGGRVLAGQQIQRRLERAAGQRRERCTSPHRVEPQVGVQGLQRARGDGVLGKHIERIRGHRQALDLPGEHPLHRHRAADQIGAVLREHHAARDLADLVPGPADPLQPVGHRRWRLHLNDEIDRAHIDSELEAGGGHHGFEPAALEVVLNRGALFLAHRAVMRPGQQRLGAVRLPAGHDVCGRTARHLGVGWRRKLDARPFGVNLVEP